MNSKWMRFNRYLYKYWRLQAAVILLGIITVPLSLLNPYLTKLVIDQAYGNRDLKLFFILAIIGASVFIINGLISSVSSYLSGRINCQVNFDMTKDLFKHLQRLPLSFFSNRSTGEHIYRMDADVRSVSTFVCGTIPRMVVLFPRLLCILVVVFYLNWKLALLAVLLVPIGYLSPHLFGKWRREIVHKMILKAQGIFKELQEVFSHILLIKALGREKDEVGKFERGLTRKIELELKEARVSSIGGFTGSILNKLLSGIIALYGGYQVIKGVMTLGSFTAIMIYVTQLTGLLRSIGVFYQTIIISSVTRDRLGEILDIGPGICDSKDAAAYYIERGEIEFKGLSFGYREGALVLKDMGFLIEPASKIALVGPSGCGKTTILLLILRLYKQAKGAIFIDGIDTKGIKLDSLKSQIGIALQEPLLWNDSVRNNILYGAEDVTDEDVIKAAKLAEAHDFIVDLPDKYHSVIGEMACKISEGQKQRIAIARLLIKKPKIIILDEAMSSLDSETEDKIIDNLKDKFSDSTIIAVSHRFSTVRKMDQVYFLQGASEMKIGTHGDLMAQNPKYPGLFASQIKTRLTP